MVGIKRGHGNNIGETINSSLKKKKSAANDIDYVYLMSGIVYHSGSEFPFGVWKGRTSSIDGFSLGLIQPDNTHSLGS
jgi:hypothetical protein